MGARLGLELKYDVTAQLTAGVSGFVGFAHRDASLTGSDTCTAAICLVNGITGSSIGANRSATPTVANAEVNLTARLLPNAAIKAFAGSNYDSAVPGVAAPVFIAAPFAQQLPAGIRFQRETSWYVGGGIAVRL